MGDIHFDCTMCGKCCHGLRLPISIDEAANWLARGGSVQLMCEAHPWPAEPAEDEIFGQYRRVRTSAARSGGLPVRIMVTLVAAFEGACPFLLPDMRCGNYEHRPRVCRIYPAEMSPFSEMKPEDKACPPEAWDASAPLLTRDGKAVDPETVTLIAQSRAASIEDRDAKARLCADLGITIAALGNEGYVVHAPDPDTLGAAIARLDRSSAAVPSQWRIASNRQSTIDMLEAAEAESLLAEDGRVAGVSYIGFFPAG